MTDTSLLITDGTFNESKAIHPEFNAVVNIKPHCLISTKNALPSLTEIEGDSDPDLGGPAYLASARCICLYKNNDVFDFAIAYLCLDTDFKNPEWVDDFSDTIPNVSGWMYLHALDTLNKIENKPSVFPVLAISQYCSGELKVTRYNSQQELDVAQSTVLGWIPLPESE